jgi:hypothetical protein
MASSLDKVQARMDTVVNDLAPINAVLLFQIRVKAGLNVFNNGPPAANCDEAWVRTTEQQGLK